MLSVTSQASGQPPGPRTHFYTAEFLRPVQGAETVALVNVVFFARPSAATAESVLRAEMESALKFGKPNFDVMGHAWFSATGSQVDEEAVKFPSGEAALLYERRTGKIREYSLAEALKGLKKK